MIAPGLRDALKQYWDATGGGALPSLPDDPAEAVLAVLGARPLKTREWRFGVFETSDPWPTLATGVSDDGAFRDVTEAALAWVFAVGEMTPVARGTNGSWVVIDRWPNEEGDRFALEVTAAGTPGKFRFDRLAVFVGWAAALAERQRDAKARVNAGIPTATRQQPAVLGPVLSHTALGALPWLLRLNPAVFFRACQRLGWPEPVMASPPYEEGRTPLRSAVVWMLVTFNKTRRVTLAPGLSESDLTPPVKTLVTQLRSLEKSLAKEAVPPYVAGLAEGEGRVAEAARRWVSTFEEVRRPAEPGVADVSAEGARFRAVYEALEQMVDDLEASEAIEIVPQRKTELVEEIMRVYTLETRPHAVVGAMVTQVVESECVDEVFVEDAVIERSLRLALGI